LEDEKMSTINNEIHAQRKVLAAEIDGWLERKFTDENYKTTREWSFDGERNPCLIVNHMQIGIAGRDGEYTGADADQQWEALERLGTIDKQKQLIAAFRERNLPIIYVAVLPNPTGFTPKWGFIFEMVNRVAPAGRLDNPHLQETTQIIPELGRLPEEPIVYHSGVCPMTGSFLHEYLKKYNVSEIVLTGWTAHSTLYNSLLQFVDNWYSVVIPADATGAPKCDQQAVDAVLDMMMNMYGLVTTVDDVIEHLPHGK